MRYKGWIQITTIDADKNYLTWICDAWTNLPDGSRELYRDNQVTCVLEPEVFEGGWLEFEYPERVS